jgi:hypothetical protein
MPSSLSDFCEKNSYPPRTVKRIIRERAVPVLKIGGKFYFDDRAEAAFWEAVRINTAVAPVARRKELEKALAATRPKRHPI